MTTPSPTDWLSRCLAEAEAAPSAGGGGRISATALVSIACDMRRIADALTAPAQAPAVDTGWREYTPAQPVEAVQ
jgi:hypothetical protein